MKTTIADPQAVAITRIVLHLYSVASQTTPGLVYTVDVQNNTCDCPAGQADRQREPEKRVGCWHRLYAAAYHRGSHDGICRPHPRGEEVVLAVHTLRLREQQADQTHN